MATSPRPYQNNFRKYSNADDISKKPKSTLKEKSMSKDRRHRLKIWTTFYRRNYHRFAEHYGGINLHFFQKIWLYLMGISEVFVAIASRGISKSWIVALYSICLCILNPNSIVIIASGSKKQGGLIITEKIQGFFQEASPNFAREIKKIVTSQDNYEVTFHNGSKIKVVTSSELARGHRSTCNIYEEFRIIDKNIIDSVLSPFLISRQPPYLLKDEYRHLAEEPKEIYISSAYYKAEWWFQELKTIVKMHFKGNQNANFIAFDYLLAVFHGLKTKNQIKKEKEKSDEISFMMEYENIPFGENKNSYFKLEMFRSNQNIRKSFYPMRSDDFIANKKNKSQIKRLEGEIRLIGVDLSSRKGSKNDNTVISCMRLLPTSKGYRRELVYMESHNGENSIIQTLRIKQVYDDFKADYIVMDIQQIGIVVYEMLGVVTRDDERDCEYPAYTIIDSPKKYIDITDSVIQELKGKTLATNAIPVIIPISASAQLNSDIAVQFRDKLQKNMLSFLIEIDKAENYMLSKNPDYITATKQSNYEDKAWFLHPYYQTNELINECVNLEYTVVAGKIKIDEKNGRKDRYTSCSYVNYIASQFEKHLLKETKKKDWSKYILY